DDDATFVDPDSLGTIEIDGRTVVPLSDLYAAADLSWKLSELMFHFAGEDGYHTREDSEVGVPAMLIEHAFVDVRTRDLVWTIEMPQSFEVKRLATIAVQYASDAPEYFIAAE